MSPAVKAVVDAWAVQVQCVKSAGLKPERMLVNDQECTVWWHGLGAPLRTSMRVLKFGGVPLEDSADVPPGHVYFTFGGPSDTA